MEHNNLKMITIYLHKEPLSSNYHRSIYHHDFNNLLNLGLAYVSPTYLETTHLPLDDTRLLSIVSGPPVTSNQLIGMSSRWEHPNWLAEIIRFNPPSAIRNTAHTR